MVSDKELTTYWEAEIRPRFSQSALEARVTLADGSSVRYANLDNAATTKPFKSVIERVRHDMYEYGSVHRGSGQHSKTTTERYEAAREAVGRFVGASAEDYVIFTRNTTDAISHAAALWATRPGRVLVSDVEHSSNLLPWLKNEVVRNKKGWLVEDNLQVFKTKNNGIIDADAIKRICEEWKQAKESYERKYHDKFQNAVKLLTTTALSNVTGYKPPIHDLAQLVHDYGAQIFLDACQLVPHQELNMHAKEDTQHIDFLAFSGHKMYAPYGAGVLIGPKDFFDGHMPYQAGGGNIAYIGSGRNIIAANRVQTHEPGTPNFIGAVAIEEAIKQLEEIGMDEVQRYEHELVGVALEGLRHNDKVKTYAAEPHGSVIPFDIDDFPPRLVSEILALEFGIGTRAGSFCTYELIRRLKGTTAEDDKKIAGEVRSGITANIPGIVRASFSIYNRPEDARRFVEAVTEISTHGSSHYKKKYSMNEKKGEWMIR